MDPEKGSNNMQAAPEKPHSLAVGRWDANTTDITSASMRRKTSDNFMTPVLTAEDQSNEHLLVSGFWLSLLRSVAVEPAVHQNLR
eukprot:4027723-Amphidinium_carterae.2